MRDEARGTQTHAGEGVGVPPVPAVREARAGHREELPETTPETTPVAPDAAPVNSAWTAEPEPPRGLAGFLRRGLDRLLRGRFEAQRAFNAHQVRFDNELLRYVDARFAATHRHYDRVLGQCGRHLGEADERHMILQEELVAHVQDLVRRIDLVLAESDRGHLALEFALEDLRARLSRLEEGLRRG